MSAAEQILRALSAAGVDYALLHGADKLGDSAWSDIDIAVRPEHLPRLRRALEQFPGARLVHLLHRQPKSFYFILALPARPRFRFLAVDAATDYRSHGLVVLRAEQLLRGRRESNGLSLASPAVELQYILAKRALKGELSADQRARLAQLARELGSEARAALRHTFGSAGEEVYRALLQRDWPALDAVLPRLRRALARQTLKRDPLSPARYWLSELVRLARWAAMRARNPTGIFVAVLGPDGAGKSTVISLLNEALRPAFACRALFHLRPTLRGKGPAGPPVTAPHASPPRSLFGSLAKLAYYVASYNLGYALRIWPMLLRSTLVLFDRYYEDLLVDPRRLRFAGPRWLAAACAKLIPRPQLYLILDAPPHVLLERKREVAPEELNRQCREYRLLARSLPEALLLDASAPAEHVALCAADAVLDYLHARYFHRLERGRVWLSSRLPEEHGLAWLSRALAPNDKAQLNSRPSRPTARDNGAPFLALPSARAPRLLIPASPTRVALSSLRLLNAQRPVARLAKALAALAITSGAARSLLAPRHGAAVAAQSPELIARISSLGRFLADRLGQPDLHLALSLGTPGVHRKPTVQLMSSEGEILGYAKVGWNEATAAIVENEQRTLLRLSAAQLPAAVPRVLFAGLWEGKRLLVLSAPSAEPLPPPRTLDDRHLKLLACLARLDASRSTLPESPFWRTLEGRTEALAFNFPFFSDLVRRAMRYAQRQLGEAALPFSLKHGDFAPWNTWLLPDGRLFVFDWEYASPASPPAWDVFHFLVQTALLLDGAEPAAAVQRVLRHPALGRHLREIGLAEEHAPALLVLFVADMLTWDLSRSGYRATAGQLRLRRAWARMLGVLLAGEESPS